MRWIASVLAALTMCLVTASTAWALSPFAVFFDANSARLSAQALAVLDNATQGIRTIDARKIVVVGGTDRSGSRAHNLVLSHRRAEVVKAALVARGVPAGSITIDAAGEDRPIIETADGISEAQNRYAMVMLMQICGDAPGFRATTGC